MPIDLNVDTDTVLMFLSSVAVGLLIGLDRERSPGSRAGVRTFALTALFGTLSALLAQQHDLTGGLILAAGLLLLGYMSVTAYRIQGDVAEPGTTTTVALLLCYALGALLVAGEPWLVAVLTLAVAALLHFKTELHGISRQLSDHDVVAILQFVAIAFVILPVLPDRGYGPYGALNPNKIWWMVVLVCGLSLTAYALLRIAQGRMGVLLLSFLGGAVSSTGTTLVLSRQLRRGTVDVEMGTFIILAANLVVLLRLTVLTAAIMPPLLLKVVPMLACAGLAGIVVPFLFWRQLRARKKLPALELKNPVELGLALASGLLFALILLVSATVHHRLGSPGTYVLALLMGLPDLDAITLSVLQLRKLDQLSPEQAATAIALAYGSNLVCKLGLVAIIGGGKAFMRVAQGYAGVAAGLALGWVLVTRL